MRRFALVPVLLFALFLSGPAAAEDVRLSLADCLERALSAALQIREGRYRPGIAETAVREAEAEFEHLLTFSTSGGKSFRPVGTTLGGAAELEEQTFSAQLGVGQKIRSGGIWSFGFQTDDLLTNNRFFTVRPQWTNALTFRIDHPLLRSAGEDYNTARTRIAEAELRAAENEYREILDRTLAAVERAYWDLGFLHADLEVKRQSLRVAQELLRISQKRLDAGAGTRVEVVQAEAGVAQREQELILAEFHAQTGEDTLRSYVFPFTDEPERTVRIVPLDRIDAPARTEADDDLARSLRAAFENRFDLAAVKERLEATGIGVDLAENELLPRLDFFTTVGLTELDDNFFGAAGDLGRAEFPAWQAGVSLELPLGNQAANARHRRALLQRAQAIAAFDVLRNRIYVEVRAAVRTIDTARREILATKRGVAAARAQFEAERDRVEADKSTNYQLLQVEQDLSTSRSQELRAVVALRKALVDLQETTGTYLSSRGLVAPDAADAPEKADAADQPE